MAWPETIARRLGGAPAPPTRSLSTCCRRGHPYTTETTGRTRAGHRFCRVCDAMRKKSHHEKTRANREDLVEVYCPSCGQARRVTKLTAKRLDKMPRLCRSCSRKAVRGKMSFAPAVCAKCSRPFSGRSGSARFCDNCAKRKPRPPKNCPVCTKKFVGYKNKETCSSSCRRRLRENEKYFGGRMFEAEGWKEKTCRICARDCRRRFHVHHVFGHPDHSRLAVLCPGCHDMVSKLAMRSTFDTEAFEKLYWYAMAQRFGRDPLAAQGEAGRLELVVREVDRPRVGD